MPKSDGLLEMHATEIDMAAKRTLESFGEVFEQSFVKAWAAQSFPSPLRTALHQTIALKELPTTDPAAASVQARATLVAATVPEARLVDTDASPIVLYVVAASRGLQRSVVHRSFTEFKALHKAIGSKAKGAVLPRDPCPSGNATLAPDVLKRTATEASRYLAAVACSPHCRHSGKLLEWLGLGTTEDAESCAGDSVIAAAFAAAWRAVGGNRFMPALLYDIPVEGLIKLLVSEGAECVRSQLSTPQAVTAAFQWLVRRLAPTAEAKWHALIERTNALRRELAAISLAEVAPVRQDVNAQVVRVVSPVLDPLIAAASTMIAQPLSLFERPVTRAMHAFIAEQPNILETLRIFAVSSPDTLEESDFDRLEVQLAALKEKVLGSVTSSIAGFLDGIKAVVPGRAELAPALKVMAKLPILARALFLLANQSNPVVAAKAFTKQRVKLLNAGPTSASKTLAAVMDELEVSLFVAKRDMDFDVWRVLYAVLRETERAHAADEANSPSLDDVAALTDAFRDFGERLALVQYGAMRKLMKKFRTVLDESARSAPESQRENWARLIGVATDAAWQAAAKFWKKRAWLVAIAAVVDVFVAFFTPCIEATVAKQCTETLRTAVPLPQLPKGFFADPVSLIPVVVHDAVDAVVRPVIESWFTKLS